MNSLGVAIAAAEFVIAIGCGAATGLCIDSGAWLWSAPFAGLGLFAFAIAAHILYIELKDFSRRRYAA